MTDATIRPDETSETADIHVRDTGPGDPADGPVDGPVEDRQPRWRPWLPWAVALIAAAVALYATVQWRDLADREAARDDVAAASAAFLTSLMTWDAGDGLDDTRTALRDAGTDDFQSEVEDLFGGSLGDALEEAGASSSGDVQDLFVQRIDGDQALVFAVVIQQVEPGDGDPQVTARSARIALIRTGEGWLVDRVELVEDALVDAGGSP